MDLEVEIKANYTAINTDDKKEVEEDKVVGAGMEGNTTETKTEIIENKKIESHEEEGEGAEEDKDEEDLEDDDGDEDEEDSIDICVDDTQPAAIMPIDKADKKTSLWYEFDNAYSDGPVNAPTTCITLDPNPTCPMSPPSFPYTFGSPEVSAPDISDETVNDTVFRSRVKCTDTQSSTTHFTASETVGGGVELIVSPKLLYNTSATGNDVFITASVPDALPSPAIATKGSDTCQASVPEMQMSSTKTGEACSLPSMFMRHCLLLFISAAFFFIM